MADLDALFFPKGIAIIGASAKPLTIGNRVMVNLLRYAYPYPVHPVHPKVDEVLDRKAYKSILEVPDPIDLVHIIVRNTLVPKVLEDCAQKGVKVAIINASGFREIGPEGQELEDRIVAMGKDLGIRLFGPNCQGVMNSDPSVSLYSNFTFAKMSPGHVSVVAQGGGVAEVINNYFGMNGIGQRFYASNGNACDISIPEIIEYYGQDDQTHVIVLHIESFRDPDEFLEKVAPVAAKKPVLALKSGSTPEGARAVSSHTGGLMAPDTSSDVLFDKCGVMRFSSLSELCETAAAFNAQPVPRGDCIGMVTNAGSPAIIITDEAVKAGMKVPDLSQKSKDTLKEKLQSIASIANPIDMMATASGDDFGLSLQTLLDDPGIDAAVVCFMTPFFVNTTAIAAAIEQKALTSKKTIIAVAMTNPDEMPQWRQTVERVRAAGVPVYYFPEVAARTLSNMNRFRILRDRPRANIADFSVDSESAKKLINNASTSDEGFLCSKDVYELLSMYGIPLVEQGFYSDWEQVRKGAAELGYPVVLKGDAPKLVHKTDLGAVALDLMDEAMLRDAFDDITNRLSCFEGLGYVLQKQIPKGLEIIIGGTSAMGSAKMVMFGLGGIHAEVFKDVAFKMAPLSEPDAEQLLDGIRSSALLDGVRGQPGVDKAVLLDLLQRVSILLTDNQRIAELDLNPVLAYPSGEKTKVVDARIRIEKA